MSDEKSKEAQYSFEFAGLLYKLTERVEKLSLNQEDKRLMVHDIAMIEHFVYSLLAEADLDGEGSWYNEGSMTEADLDKLGQQIGETYEEENTEIAGLNAKIGEHRAFVSACSLPTHPRHKNPTRQYISQEETEEAFRVSEERGCSVYDVFNVDSKVVGVFEENGKFKKVDNPSL